MKLWLIAIRKFLSRAIPKFLVNRGVLKLTGKKSLMVLSFVVLTAAIFIYGGRHSTTEQQPASPTSNVAEPPE